MIRWLIAFALFLAIPGAQAGDRDWVTSWATAVMPMEGDSALPAAATGAIVIRQTVRLSAGGSRMRLRLSNRHGDTPLRVAGVRVGRAAAAGVAAAVPGTEHRVTFAGNGSVSIPADADYWSDPIALPVAALAHVAIRLDLAERVPRTTGHPGARTTSHLAWGEQSVRVARWYHLAAIDVDAPGVTATAVLGESITDGYGVVENSDARWPDYLAARPAGRARAVANLGIGGNRLLLDGSGPNALARFDRDALALSGVDRLIVLIGVNDLGTLTRERPVPKAAHSRLVADMIAGYRQIAARARAAGVCVIGATIMPYAGSEYYHPDRDNEADRQVLNAYIRAPGSFDAVLDFDAAMRDRTRPERLRADVDSGDGLHPSPAGYRTMAEAVPPAMIEQSCRRSPRRGG